MSLEFKLEEFIPYYVDYNDTSSIYDLPEGDQLYYSTLFKKEFDDLRLDKVDEIKFCFVTFIKQYLFILLKISVLNFFLFLCSHFFLFSFLKISKSPHIDGS